MSLMNFGFGRSLAKIISSAVQAAAATITGLIASGFYQFEDYDGHWVWACDVDIGNSTVLRCVPVASNNREIIYAQQGKGVTLSRMGNGKWAITGLAKTVKSLTHITYLSFTDDVYEITGTELRGYLVRPLTYGELGTLIPGVGYGQLPEGAQGRFNADGSFLEIVED